MLPLTGRSLKFQVVAVVAAGLLVPVLVMLYDIIFASHSDDVLLGNMEERLGGMASYLAGAIEARAGANPDPAVLGEAFDEIAGRMARSYPGVRLGLYLVDEDRILIQGFLHEYRQLSPEEARRREARVYREAAQGIEAVKATGKPVARVGETWDDRFLEQLVPVYVNDQLVAVAWAEERMHPIFAQSTRMRLMIRYVTLFAFGAGAFGMLTIILNLTRRVGQIQRGLARLEQDLSQTLPEMPGEMGQISRAINHLARSLVEKEQLLEEYRRSQCLVALGRLVTNIAHELKNPVSIIKATAQLMASNIKDVPALDEYVKMIEEQANRHNNLIKELIEFGRPNDVRFEEVKPGELVAEVLESTAPLLRQHNITLDLDIEPSLPVIKGDRERLKQVFINLILNAVQVMPDGGRLSVCGFATGEAVCISFRDTGPGIAEEDLKQIFEPFYTTKPGGGGLGLALSDQIVKIHGGEIRAESGPGGGATFTVCLPRSLEQEVREG
ncbi:MAG: Integral membrane sensor signal transduction histidine kinase [Clostridia bacterium 62_21]|nr:MAG: Integral membrane sensor signal transduction histidine kinase [Clostridia bacterium 62_21]